MCLYNLSCDYVNNLQRDFFDVDTYKTYALNVLKLFWYSFSIVYLIYLSISICAYLFDVSESTTYLSLYQKLPEFNRCSKWHY